MHTYSVHTVIVHNGDVPGTAARTEGDTWLIGIVRQCKSKRFVTLQQEVVNDNEACVEDERVGGDYNINREYIGHKVYLAYKTCQGKGKETNKRRKDKHVVVEELEKRHVRRNRRGIEKT